MIKNFKLCIVLTFNRLIFSKQSNMNKINTLNIIFITKGTLPFPPVKGGAVENLLQIIVEKNEAYCDFKFTVFSISDNKIVNDYDNKYAKCSIKYINGNSCIYKLKRFFRYLINRNKLNYFGNQFINAVCKKIIKDKIYYDAIILENAPEYAIPLKKITNKPIIQHLHNDYLYKDAHLYRSIIKNSDLFLCVSNYISQRVSTVVDDIRKIKTLYNGLDLRIFNGKILNDQFYDLRSKFNISINDLVIVYSGRLQPHKGVKELFLAFERIAPLYNVKLLIIGASGYSTTDKSGFIKDLEDISLSFRSQVIFTGFIDYSNIANYYKICDVSVIPSFVEEAFGLTCLESMASALPVIVTNAGALPELVNDDSAFIIDKNKDVVSQIEEKLILLIENEELRESMGKAARLRSQLFSDEKFYQNFKKLINENI